LKKGLSADSKSAQVRTDLSTAYSRVLKRKKKQESLTNLWVVSIAAIKQNLYFLIRSSFFG
jgi:hypothetical protein